jgi:hypothetical protein
MSRANYVAPPTTEPRVSPEMAKVSRVRTTTDGDGNRRNENGQRLTLAGRVAQFPRRPEQIFLAGVDPPRPGASATEVEATTSVLCG